MGFDTYSQIKLFFILKIKNKLNILTLIKHDNFDLFRSLFHFKREAICRPLMDLPIQTNLSLSIRFNYVIIVTYTASIIAGQV